MARKNPWFNAAFPHHRPDGFSNLTPGGHASGDVKRWRQARKAAGLPRPPAKGYASFIAQWWQHAEISGDDDRIWWLGHSSILLRLMGQYILTDPVFSDRASPLRFVGPKRRTPPALTISELPSLDTIVISHNHYDNLDARTMRALIQRFPQVTIFVPLGLGNGCRRLGARNVIELDWWQSVVFQGLVYTAVPAQHWSMRTPWDRNFALWCGWVIESSAQRFWFPGDTGYSEDLLAIPQRLGPLSLAALPIGAYAPRWFMSYNHMDPQQAVTLWQQLGKPLSFPVHWGVFELADESLDEPLRELDNALNETAEDITNFMTLKMGQYLSLQNTGK
ncbi:MBL fold metallo-hydrolase [Escherichia coli]|nr:MBL fold metallo-hydrolase [Escherichia coli]